MSFAYVDSSALIKLLVDEDGTDLAVTIWERSDVRCTSRLAFPEVCAGLAALAATTPSPVAPTTGRSSSGRPTGVRPA